MVECRICNLEVACSNFSRATSHQGCCIPSLRLSVNEYQLSLGRQSQVWLIPLADEHRMCSRNCVIPWQCMLYLNALETLHVEVLYKSTTFTFFCTWLGLVWLPSTSWLDGPQPRPADFVIWLGNGVESRDTIIYLFLSLQPATTWCCSKQAFLKSAG